MQKFLDLTGLSHFYDKLKTEFRNYFPHSVNNQTQVNGNISIDASQIPYTASTKVQTPTNVQQGIDKKINEPMTEGNNGYFLSTNGSGGRSWKSNTYQDLGILPVNLGGTNASTVNQAKQNLQIRTGLFSAVLDVNNWIWVGTGEGADAHANQWHFDRYTSITANPTMLDSLNTMVPLASTYYVDSSTSITMNIADSYTGKAVTYLYTDEAQQISMRFETDDNGAVYLNGEFICSIASCAWTTVQTLQLKKGENQLIVCYTEGSGGDGWVCDPKPSTLVGSVFTLMSGTPVGSYTQTVPLTSYDNNIAPTNKTILFSCASNLSNDPDVIENLSVINYHGSTVVNNNNTVTVTIDNHPCVDGSVTCYWLGYTLSN